MNASRRPEAAGRETRVSYRTGGFAVRAGEATRCASSSRLSPSPFWYTAAAVHRSFHLGQRRSARFADSGLRIAAAVLPRSRLMPAVNAPLRVGLL
ncbi:hypothetical protein MTO96_003205 [Rhipicephalus appendiculatus]